MLSCIPFDVTIHNFYYLVIKKSVLKCTKIETIKIALPKVMHGRSSPGGRGRKGS